MAKSEFVTILATGDRASMATAKSLLESVGIEYYVKGEDVQNLIGFGAIDGVPVIQVAEENAEDAKKILEGLEK
ncbi:MAG: DUF2007 domain-containing protein [Candidatus Omnitrophica bacterium]|nr:DUF2007 domain-containing protein [Candidatus Omnitrophota bacterium]MDD5311192.1 DUF2007 domain-containing protein [Candidatus Omnitrophota bacterium]MDD5547218.1 DUF2007 domain-containing protein [Candidatus Omnitrophota bacterium]